MSTLDRLIRKYVSISQSPAIVAINDIPNIDLYMDQVTTFMDQALCPYKRGKDDKILTKTMINNYAKAKIFPAPVKKKYTKTHIMLLIMIYHLKSVLSIRDIGILLSPILSLSSWEEQEKMVAQVYEGVTQLQKATYHTMKSSALGEKSPIFIEVEIISQFEDEAVKKILLVLLLAIRAYAEKRLAEYILDVDF